MAELTDSNEGATAVSTCCAPEQQVDCCEPTDKAGCCSAESSSCGCSAGPSDGEGVREAVRSRYAAAGETVLDLGSGGGIATAPAGASPSPT